MTTTARPDGDTEANDTCPHTLTRLPVRDVSTGTYACPCCFRTVFGGEAWGFLWDGNERRTQIRIPTQNGRSVARKAAWCWDCGPAANEVNP